LQHFPYAPINTLAATLQAEIAAKQKELEHLGKNVATVLAIAAEPQ